MPLTKTTDLLPMSLLAFGLNYKTASIATRECTAFTPERVVAALQDLVSQGAANEAVLLSTCNRTELYTDAHDPALLGKWLAEQHQLREEKLRQCWYFHQDQAAVCHAMRVASGLDSMVLGESQILGQMKTAYAVADQAGTIGVQLGHLFQTVFTVTKQIRTDTAIGVNPVSVAYAAVSLAKRIFTDLSQCTVLLIGAGETIELTATHLANQGVKRIVVANRHVDKAQRLADRFYGHGIAIGDVPVYLSETDIVITATASQLPILGKGSVERALKARKHKPIFMVDLAVPRDIEPEIAELPDAYLYNVDDLRGLVQENLQSRRNAAEQAEAIIEIQAKYYMHKLRELNANDTIRDLRHKLEKIRDQATTKALAQLQRGVDPQQVAEQMAFQLTNKILHRPTTQLRQVAFDGRGELLLLARHLFDL